MNKVSGLSYSQVLERGRCLESKIFGFETVRYPSDHPGMPTEQFGYDSVGNRLSAEGEAVGTPVAMSYTYDFENRLIKVQYPGMLAQYKYDPLGRRIEKDVNGDITRYVYDGSNIVTEYDGNGIVKNAYIHNLAIDDPLALQQGTGTYFYHKDGLGSVVNLTDGTGRVVNLTDINGNVVKSYTYKSFGEIYSESGTLNQPCTFTGREYDPESGLYYYRARYYDPKVGRFITKDPIGLAAGDVNLYRYVDSVGKPYFEANPYVYVQNDPINFADPFGLKRGDWWDPRTYIEISQSYTYLMVGKQTNRSGSEQWMLSFITFIGRSIDISLVQITLFEKLLIRHSRARGNPECS